MRVPKIILLLIICIFIFDVIEAKIQKKRHHGLRDAIKKRTDRHDAKDPDPPQDPAQDTAQDTTQGTPAPDQTANSLNAPSNGNADPAQGTDPATTGPTCRYQERDGTCQATCARANSATDAAKIQTPCADSTLTCCFTEETTNWCSRGHQAGSCITPAACAALNTAAAPHHTSSNLCRGAANAANKCCLSGIDKTEGFDTSTLNTLVDIPTNINSDLTSAAISFQKSAMGDPGVRCSTDACLGCCESESSITRNNLVDMDVGPFNLRVFRPFGEAVKQVFEDVLTARPELFWYVSTAGSFCCRPVKQDGHAIVGTFSNHAWGAAVDLFYGATNDRQGDNKAQQGLLDLVPFFNAKKLFWGGGFRNEDSMHFEASKQAVIEWGCSGAYASTGFPATIGRVGGVPCPAGGTSGETADNSDSPAAAGGTVGGDGQDTYADASTDPNSTPDASATPQADPAAAVDPANV